MSNLKRIEKRIDIVDLMIYDDLKKREAKAEKGLRREESRNM